MKNNKTEIVFILDKSGSMHGLEADTVGGFNSMLEKQRGEEGECLVTTILFNDKTEFLHDRLPIEEIKEITCNEYRVGGCTALIDAIGSTITHISGIHKYSRNEDVPEKTMFVITTDGMENASVKFTSDMVKKMINEKKECGWEFLFIGANIDAVKTAANFGIEKNRAVNYHADKKGTKTLYETVGSAVHCFRCCEAPLSDDWSEDIAKDFKSRHK